MVQDFKHRAQHPGILQEVQELKPAARGQSNKVSLQEVDEIKLQRVKPRDEKPPQVPLQEVHLTESELGYNLDLFTSKNVKLSQNNLQEVGQVHLQEVQSVDHAGGRGGSQLFSSYQVIIRLRRCPMITKPIFLNSIYLCNRM